MGAVPKYRISKARKNRRRAHHALKEPEVIKCPICGAPKRPHFRCDNCGNYGPAKEEPKNKTKEK